MPIKIQFKRLSPSSKLPVRRYVSDAGFDLFADVALCIHPGQTQKLDCGIAVNIPDGYYGLILPRSSWRQKGLLCQSVYDAGFQGLIEPFVTNTSNSILYIQNDERILQLIVHQIPIAEIEVVEEFIESERGTKGAGSTGRF